MVHDINLAIDDNLQLPDQRPTGGFPNAARETRLDRLTRLVQDVFDVPISLISLTTTDRLPADVFIGPSRRKTFVYHPQHCHSVSWSAPRDDGVLKFVGGQTDTGPGAPLDSPFRCFAAHMGVPIHLDGAVVGALWVFDQKPRHWSAQDISQLKSFAALVADEMGHSRLIRSAKRRTSHLSSAHAQALQASHAKSDFITSMKHEIASPLIAIFGYAELLIAENGNTLKQTHYLENVLNASEKLSSLAEDFQDPSGTKAGEVTISQDPFALDALFSNVKSIVQLSAQHKAIDLYIEVDPDLPETLLGDEPRLHQVLLNLLTNAIKFTCEGSVTLRAARDATTHDAVRFEVTDTGIGIDVENQKRIFERGAQATASTQGEFGGSGLGLSISKTLVGLMGGTIGVESDPGHGATFWFTVTLPIPSTSQKSAA
ncbi:GAF domain-containing protein [Rhodobacteraceae bacterium W635]|uniref:GAF domain-containing sensor histidine kinase n=1 Tax=Nioella halotolerans TaxID=2303578 RepID=UPI000E3E6F68|nr:GAF domain-containing protein [Rhodobacteraceae bacterium W635]